MNTWFERNSADTAPHMNNLLLPDEATTPPDHEILARSTDQISWRISPESLPSQQEIPATSSAPRPELNLYGMVPNRKIVHAQEPESTSSMRYTDANLVPPRIKLLSRHNLQQTSPLMKNVLHPQRNEAILNLVSPPEVNDTSIYDLPTQLMVAVGMPVLKGGAKKSKKKSLLGIVVRAG